MDLEWTFNKMLRHFRLAFTTHCMKHHRKEPIIVTLRPPPLMGLPRPFCRPWVLPSWRLVHCVWKAREIISWPYNLYMMFFCALSSLTLIEIQFTYTKNRIHKAFLNYCCCWCLINDLAFNKICFIWSSFKLNSFPHFNSKNSQNLPEKVSEGYRFLLLLCPWNTAHYMESIPITYITIYSLLLLHVW